MGYEAGQYDVIVIGAGHAGLRQPSHQHAKAPKHLS